MIPGARRADLWDNCASAVRTMVDMSATLGQEHAINGQDFPHMQRFYLLALHVAKRVKYTNPVRSTKQSQHPNSKRQLFFSGSVQNCMGKNCPRGCRGPHCLGMCGPGCTCWQWVCDTCCIQNQCYDHDKCCNRYGFSNSRCWSIVLTLYHRYDNFPCNKRYSCSSVMSGH